MKYVIIIPDGCADEPQDSLGGKTPLQSANVPAMDAIATEGLIGRSNNVPAQFTPGSEVANMSLFGYDPEMYFTGRAPIEAAAQGIELGENDWAVRCNLVTIVDRTMKSFTAGHIESADAKALLESAQRHFEHPGIEFLAGVSYRNLLIVRNREIAEQFSNETRTTAPHDLTDSDVCDDYPRGPGSGWLSDIIDQSADWFADDPVNQQRVQEGKLPATNMWLWGLGKRPSLDSFRNRFGLSGSMITAVDLLRGLARLIGWDVINVKGATGYLDTDYSAKGQACINALKNSDIICVHIEATDEASHEGLVEAKIKALEEIDSKIVHPVFAALQEYGDYRIMVTPDHPTLLRTKTHSHGYVPFCVCGKGIDKDRHKTYDEITAEQGTQQFDRGCELMNWFIDGE
jgi:2,3-bisphosphoglycerate-independent phosphoglycerate mutase